MLRWTARMGSGALLALGVVLAAPGAARPQEAETGPADAASERKQMKEEVEKADKLQAMRDAPPGVFDPVYKDGFLERVKIKGEASVTTALSSANAERLARDKAMRDAKAQFLKWLKEEASLREDAQEGTVVAEKDGKQTASLQEVTSTQFQSRAQGVLRGMIVLMDEVRGGGSDRRYMLVYGWSRKLANAARSVKADMESEEAPAEGAKGSQKTKTRSAKDTENF